MEPKLAEHGAKLVKKIKGVIKYVITDSGSGTAEYTLDLKNGSGKLYKGAAGAPKPNMTLTVSDENMCKLIEGKLNAQSAFMGGKIKIKGVSVEGKRRRDGGATATTRTQERSKLTQTSLARYSLNRTWALP